MFGSAGSFPNWGHLGALPAKAKFTVLLGGDCTPRHERSRAGEEERLWLDGFAACFQLSRAVHCSAPSVPLSAELSLALNMSVLHGAGMNHFSLHPTAFL